MKSNKFLFLVLWICTYLIFTQVLYAQIANTASEKLLMKAKQNEVESLGKQRVEAVLSRLCPGSCELLDLKAIVSQPKPVGEVLPGFDQVSASEVVVESIEGKILIDKALPGSFKSSLAQMLQYRLADLSPKVIFTTTQLQFPKPQNAPAPPPLEDEEEPAEENDPEVLAEKPVPEPVPEPVPPQPLVEEKPKAQHPLEDDFFKQILLMWLPLVMVMLFATLLTIYLIKSLRKFEAQHEEQKLKREKDKELSHALADEYVSMPAIDEMNQMLRKSRSIQNKLLRKWIEEDLSEVALLVRLLGADLLYDLKQDPAIKKQLEELSHQIANQRTQVSPQQAHQLYQALQARILAVQVLFDEKQSLNAWDFLQGLSLSNLKKLYQSLNVSEKEHLISQLSVELRPQFLNQLDNMERNELMLYGGAEGNLSKAQSLELAGRLKKQSEELSPVGQDLSLQVNLISEMLNALTFQAQIDSAVPLKSKREDLALAVFDNLLLEASLFEVAQDALSNAILKTPFSEMIDMLRGAQPMIKDLLLSAIIPQELGKYEEELLFQLQSIEQAQYLKARASFLHHLIKTLQRDGISLRELNLQMINKVKIV